MEKQVFIQSNNKQLLGARLAKFAIEKNASKPIHIEILNVDELPIFKKLNGKEYLFNETEIRVYDDTDLQYFTLTRFMPPEQMQFSGRAVVIDPDIFALTNIHTLLEHDMGEHAILACSKKGAWDSSVMLLDCEKLLHWRIADIIERLVTKKIDYTTIMTLQKENVEELERAWNSLDELNDHTKMLHTTNRLTQPWKTGLPIDFTRNKMQKFFGIIPRELIHKLLGKYQTRYQQHPNKDIETFFFELTKDALRCGAITKDYVQHEIESGHVRPDLFSHLS
ncbi:MAG TPA: hypothetical protein VJH21_00615 [Candidatus Paceibacterota bacterium]